VVVGTTTRESIREGESVETAVNGLSTGLFSMSEVAFDKRTAVASKLQLCVRLTLWSEVCGCLKR